MTTVERKTIGDWRLRWVIDDNRVIIDWDVLHIDCNMKGSEGSFMSVVPIAMVDSVSHQCRFCKTEVPAGVMLALGARRMK